MEKILVQNGFTDKEAKIYLTVLELGETPVSRISSKTGLKRTTVYSVVDALKSKGVLSSVKRKGIAYISPLSPRVLIDRFKNASMMAEQALPELIDLAYSSPLKPRLRFFEGLEGSKEVLQEYAQSKIPAMGFTDYEKMPTELFQYIRKVIIPQRKKQKNRAQLIVPDNKTNELIQREDSRYFSEHKLVHFPIPQNNPIELLLFENSKVAFLSFGKHEMFGIILDSPAIYNTLKNIFQLVWQSSS